MAIKKFEMRALLPPLTTRQVLYLLLMHSLGAGILDAGINFVIAYFMYRDQPTYLWKLPNTIAGDAAVTVLIQVTLTWIIDGGLVHNDVRKGVTQPIITSHNEDTSSKWTLPRRGFLGWLCASSLDIFAAGLPFTERMRRLGNAAVRGFVVSICVLPIFWGIGIGLACATWTGLASGDQVSGWPGPQIFKAVYAFVLGAFTTPLSSIVGMAQAGDLGSEIDEASSDTTLENLQSASDLVAGQPKSDQLRSTSPSNAPGPPVGEGTV
ncbi:uncharacterized protein SPPG_06512 [Spizellomyces punctatus DAOM BR117]|uniref:Uncharacterized protein n=1 Tax=Spizellomyces punctatus (strain DAOM BR117) TaxID=645134 RepID=A0A0L0HBK8_SPIPD|nr:uncharacterized protein SPPG_06512 [Spizellomyces punctatus DAOM BR117]KNC98103.1 hypothetical protein SPPG_06512 [Spizellomyces punctatus DAOM BR117]|eukprot:XP_016606143.1 hypothetical protein SPPG_06512 [Spizellomyces punctatus DAOM BR117]